MPLYWHNSYNLIYRSKKMFNAHKLHWSESKKQVILEITPPCIFQREPSTSRILTSYDYKDIEFLANISDVPNAFVIANNGFSRYHLFQCDDRDNLLKTILDFAGNYVGISMRLKKETITLDQFWNDKFGKFR
jgi:DnaJ family protein C protein 13